MAEIQLEHEQKPARLRIYIGAAPGVGKTYKMLNDAYLLKHQQGVDVVIGLVEPSRAKRPSPGFATSRSCPSMKSSTTAST